MDGDWVLQCLACEQMEGEEHALDCPNGTGSIEHPYERPEESAWLTD